MFASEKQWKLRAVDPAQTHVIVTSFMDKLQVNEETSQLIVGAGVENSHVSNKALESGLTGIRIF